MVGVVRVMCGKCVFQLSMNSPQTRTTIKYTRIPTKATFFPPFADGDDDGRSSLSAVASPCTAHTPRDPILSDPTRRMSTYRWGFVRLVFCLENANYIAFIE